jgi:hypothetical protein
LTTNNEQPATIRLELGERFFTEGREGSEAGAWPMNQMDTYPSPFPFVAFFHSLEISRHKSLCDLCDFVRNKEFYLTRRLMNTAEIKALHEQYVMNTYAPGLALVEGNGCRVRASRAAAFSASRLLGPVPVPAGRPSIWTSTV